MDEWMCTKEKKKRTKPGKGKGSIEQNAKGRQEAGRGWRNPKKKKKMQCNNERTPPLPNMTSTKLVHNNGVQTHAISIKSLISLGGSSQFTRTLYRNTQLLQILFCPGGTRQSIHCGHRNLTSTASILPLNPPPAFNLPSSLA